jgi:cytochrome c-type protein NapB
MKKILLSSAVIGLLILTGCNQANTTTSKNVTTTPKKVAKPVEVTGIRKSNLNKESENLPVVKYTQTAPIPGQVKPFKKSYVTAPPMIPHSIKGMVPITVKRNMCLSCHLPQNAKALGVVPMPPDHFVDNFDGNKHTKKVAGSRWFCTTCHVPQANIPLAVENKFESLKGKAGLK